MSNHIFNGVSCSGIYGNIDQNKQWVVYVWYIDSEIGTPTYHIMVNNLQELDNAIKDIKTKFGEDSKYIVILQDNDHNYIPISFSDESLKLALETDEEFWDRIADEYLDEFYDKECELVCASM